jgi:TP901 family phage tail tape measure protein
LANLTSTVRFLGDASQLLATYRLVGNQGRALQEALNRSANASIPRGFQGPGSELSGYTKFGPVIKGVRTELDALNNTFHRTSQTAIRYVDKAGKVQEIFGSTLHTTAGNAQQALGALSRLNTVSDRYSAISTRAAQATNLRRDAYRALTRSAVESTRASIGSIRAAQQAGTIDPGNARYLIGKEASRLKSFLENPAISQARLSYIDTYNKQLKLAATNTELVRRATSNLDRAFSAAPPIPANIQQLGRVSPQLLTQLGQQGLAVGDSAKLYQQNPIIRFEEDMRTGVRKISGHFETLDGFTKSFTANIDKNGRVLTQFGRTLSGFNNFLRQTVANFQKVVQWTVATTAVFGALAFAARELSVLVDIDKTLRQLGITAQLTQEETKGLFSDIADIAIATATPLQDMLKSTDDIALAVREAGKSADQYKTDILNLTEAVGIYTNLTGQDTVKATDTLVATMKQLGLETDEVVGVLSKITAVAGGQSTAIADVATGLGAMAEAARQAGLDLNETVATVQVLSQVTSKTPSEVATSFKNLVGALDSRAGAKALAEFDIALRDNAGNLRNILDIYGEISDKIRQGIIPAADVKGLVKAIAGGPRRAPDAAALLSAIGDIEEATARAAGASNEALIANAKILDTTQAKITQLQATIDRVAFEKFGEAFKETATTFITALTGLLDIINKIPTGFLAMGIQAAAFIVTVKLLTLLVTKLLGGIGGLAQGLIGLSGAFKAANTSAAQFASTAGASGLVNQFGAPIATATRTSRFAGFTRGTGLALGAGALLGGGLSLATGGDTISAISGALTGGGLAALTAPVPLPWLKIGGAISLAAGFLLDFIPRNKQANESMEETALKAEKVVNAFQQFKEAQGVLDRLGTEQEELAASIEKLQNTQNRSAAENSQLLDFQATYIQNAQAMSEANNQVAESMKAITEVAPELRKAFEAAQRGDLSPAELEKAIRAQQLVLLQLSDPNAQLPEGVPFFKPERLPIQPFSQGELTVEGGTELKNPLLIQLKASTEAQLADIQRTVATGMGTTKTIIEDSGALDLTSLEESAERVKELFNKAGTEFTASLVPSGQNIDLINGALAELESRGDESYATLRKTFDEWLRGKDAVTAFYANIQSYQNRIDAIKLFEPEVGAELQKVLDLVKQISDEAIKAGDAETLFKAQKILYDTLFSGKEFTEGQGRVLAGLRADQLGLDPELVDRMKVINDILIDFGFNWEFLGQKASAASEEVADAIQEQQDSLLALADSVAQQNALQSAQLTADFQAGEFKGNEEVYNRQIGQLNAITEGIHQVTEAYAVAIEVIPNFDAALADVAVSLQNINGLQDASSLSAGQLIERVYELAKTYGLNQTQTEKLTDKMLDLLQVIRLVNGIKGSFSITADVDLTTAIKKLRALAAAVAATGPLGGIAALPLYAAVGILSAANSTISNIGGSLNNTFRSGSGSNFSTIPSRTGGSGSGSRTGSGSGATSPGYDVSLIDIPDAIAGAYNRDALIQEAIRRAKQLQSKIPGAAKEAKNDIVEIMLGTQRLIEVRGVKDDLLRRALEELADIEKKRLEFETKADTIRRIRVGAGDFAALANVPLNTRTGVSVGSAQGPITVNLNINGQLLTPAQFAQLADQIAAAIKRQIGA